MTVFFMCVERHPIEYAIDGTNRWWQSPSIKNGRQFHWVTITLDLRQVHEENKIKFTLHAFHRHSFTRVTFAVLIWERFFKKQSKMKLFLHPSSSLRVDQPLRRVCVCVCVCVCVNGGVVVVL